MTLQELCLILGKSESTLTSSFRRTQEILAKKKIYIRKIGTGKNADYQISYGEKNFPEVQQELRLHEKPLGAAEDLTGQRFGKVVALYRVEDDGKHTCWRCKCDCGNEFETLAQNLKKGVTQSCGCQMEEVRKINGEKRKSDLVGQTFGRLTVLAETPERKNGKVVWLCQCTCGNITKVQTDYLKSGHTQSCGCISSTGEAKIKSILQEHNISFEEEKQFDGCINPSTGKPLRFDFFVEGKYLIEYDGIHHFQEVEYFTNKLEEYQKRDKIKNDWAKEHGIPLIRIPYTQLNNLSFEDLQLVTSKFIEG